MGSLKDPKTWVPYVTTKDCSKRICNFYCPQWCNYIVLPSPPPPPPVFLDDNTGGPTLSPLVIAVIGVLGSAFLLISYYVIISRFCIGNNDTAESFTGRGVHNQETPDLEMEEHDFNIEDDPSNYAPWYVSGKGLDEALIKSITVCKYKKGDGLVLGTDCSVCLGEFQEDDTLRILPKCTHAFHVYCIDTWLKTHPNCPLCRANVYCTNAKPPIIPSPPPPPPPPLPVESSSDSRNREGNFSRRVTSDIGGRDATIEIREEGGGREIRRSVSMGYLSQTQVSMADVLFVDQEDEMGLEECGSSKREMEGNNRNLNCVGLRRSFSSGRYLFTRGWKGGNNEVVPL